MSLKRAITIEDLRRLALRYLPDFLGQYVERGAGDGGGVRSSVEAFDNYQFVPRSLVEVTPVSTQKTIFGRSYALPYGISAIGSLGLFRRNADEALADAARQANIPFMLSGCSMAPIERIMSIAPEHTWCQLYASTEWSITLDMIRRAREAGVQVLVLTVDFPIANRSEVGSRSPISPASGPDWRRWREILYDLGRHPKWTLDVLRHGGLPMMESWAPYAPEGSDAAAVTRFYNAHWPGNLNWNDIARVRDLWPGQMVVKGLIHPSDVLMAAERSVDAVAVSTHGGNRLDCLVPSLQMLGEVRSAVGSRVSLFLDGGIRHGTDLLKALALGADFCFIGRAALYGVVAGGPAGARRSIRILASELAYAQAMIGCPDYSHLSAESVRSAQRVVSTSTASRNPTQ